ncbi:MAG: hypothetical protein FWE19_03125 [Oscillospiraceae bacterium]|nr:hypothetical protein [Oscillospiraceae bacterium]
MKKIFTFVMVLVLMLALGTAALASTTRDRAYERATGNSDSNRDRDDDDNNRVVVGTQHNVQQIIRQWTEAANSAGTATTTTTPAAPAAPAATTPAAPQQETPITWADADEITGMVSEARTGNGAFIQTSSSARYGLRAASWRPLDGANMRFEHDSTNANGGTDVRLVVDRPQQVTGDLLVSGWISGANADWVRAHFDRFFSNTVRVVHLDQTGEFGQTVRVAARLNLEGMNVDNLVFYSFNREANTMRIITEPNHRVIDGFLWFYTDVGGAIVISNGTLVRS